MLNFQTADILGVQIACLDRQGLLTTFADLLDAKSPPSPYLFTYANPHCLNIASRDPVYKTGLSRFDLVYADGFGTVLAGRLLGTCRLEKLTGADWIGQLFQHLALRSSRVFILGGRPGVAQRAVHNLLEKYPGFVISGTADGYFEPGSEGQVLAQIRASKPDVLFVGMGVPRQEKWILAHSEELPVKICWAVGALFDYVAGEIPRAPSWLLALQLEWLWRLYVDPARTWRRYILGIPYFFYQVLAARRKGRHNLRT